MTNDIAKTLADVLAVFAARKTAIEAKAKTTRVGNHVLRFDETRFVCGTLDNPTITGFEHAIVFGDREAAIAYLRRTNIRDGNQTAPSATLAFNAAQGALVELDRVSADLSSRWEA